MNVSKHFNILQCFKYLFLKYFLLLLCFTFIFRKLKIRERILTMKTPATYAFYYCIF